MSIEATNMELMQTLDDSWNSQDWDTFERRHKVDTVVRWPAQPPTHGARNHRAESVRLFKIFPDNQVESALQGLLRERRMDLLDLALHRHDERPDDTGRRQGRAADRKTIRGRFLGGSALGQRDGSSRRTSSTMSWG